MLKKLPSCHVVSLTLILIAQIIFWSATNRITPDMSIIPENIDRQSAKALAFGDNQFFFRIMAFRLGNAGDTFGRNTALYKYDLNKVKNWFMLLDDFDEKSNILPSLASYYFSQTQNTPDVTHMVEYLESHAGRNLVNKWWWQSQAAYLAMHKLEDNERALELAKPLIDVENIPLWAKQMAAFVYEQQGEFDSAFSIMEHILDNTDQIKPGELRFMRHFIEERINKLDKLKENSMNRLDEAKNQSEIFLLK